MARYAQRALPPVPPPYLPPGRVATLAGRGEVFYRHHEGGRSGEPTVVLLHGWTATADLQWFTAYEQLGARYPFLAIDHRGHGRGLRSEQRFTLEGAADDAAALCEHLGLRDVILVGYSMGGPIAMLTAHRHPDLAAGIVCMATALEWRDSVTDRAQWFGLFFLDILLRSRFSRHGNRFGFERLARGRPEVEPYVGWLLAESRRGDPAALVEAGRALSLHDARAWAAELRRIPATVVYTTMDQLVKVDKQAALGAALDAEFLYLAGDHFVSVARPRAFSDATRAAVDRVAARVSVARQARASAVA
jgi:3-oxoadipate enol-lactonase